MYEDFAAADEMKRMTARQRISEIAGTIALEGKWLDVGCANGAFVEAISERGVEAEGVELSQHAVSIGRQRDLNLHVGPLEDLPHDDLFDCITAFDVLEHVLEPIDFLASLFARLNEGGHVVLTVPNTGGGWSCLRDVFQPLHDQSRSRELVSRLLFGVDHGVVDGNLKNTAATSD